MAEGETKKYFWLKLKKDFFKRHDITIIEAMPNGKDYILFYLKLLCESVDHEGNLRFSDEIPYNEEMLATITRTNVDVVRSAIKIFAQLNMMEIYDDGTYFMNEVKKMMGYETEWARKKREYRERKIIEKEDIVLPLSDKSKSIDIEIEEKESSVNHTTKEKAPDVCLTATENDDVLEMFNKFWTLYPRKVNKQGAYTSFKRIPKLKRVFETIMQALTYLVSSYDWTKEDGRYIPHPTTFINQRRWEDEDIQEQLKKTTGSKNTLYEEMKALHPDYSEEQLERLVENGGFTEL